MASSLSRACDKWAKLAASKQLEQRCHLFVCLAANWHAFGLIRRKRKLGVNLARVSHTARELELIRVLCGEIIHAAKLPMTVHFVCPFRKLRAQPGRVRAPIETTRFAFARALES